MGSNRERVIPAAVSDGSRSSPPKRGVLRFLPLRRRGCRPTSKFRLELAWPVTAGRKVRIRPRWRILGTSNRLDEPDSANGEPDNDNCGRDAYECRKSCQRSKQLVVNASEAAVAEDHNYISGSSEGLQSLHDLCDLGLIESRLTGLLNRLHHFPRVEPVVLRHLFYAGYFR